MVILLFSFTSCSDNSNPIKRGETNTKHYSEYIDEEIELRNYYTLEGYQKYFWKKAKQEETFIGYDMLEFLGEFDGCVIYLDRKNGTNNRYSYNFIDEEGFIFHLDIYTDLSNAEDFETSSVIQLKNPADLRTCGYFLECVHVVNDIRYEYDKAGRLKCISWFTDTHYFKLYVRHYDYSDDFYHYDTERDTFITKLLNTETAAQAVAELNKKIERELAWNRFMANATIPLIITGIALFALISFLVIRKGVLGQNAKEKAMLLESDNLQNEPPADCNEQTPADAATDNICQPTNGKGAYCKIRKNYDRICRGDH